MSIPVLLRIVSVSRGCGGTLKRRPRSTAHPSLIKASAQASNRSRWVLNGRSDTSLPFQAACDEGTACNECTGCALHEPIAFNFYRSTPALSDQFGEERNGAGYMRDRRLLLVHFDPRCPPFHCAPKAGLPVVIESVAIRPAKTRQVSGKRECCHSSPLPLTKGRECRLGGR